MCCACDGVCCHTGPHTYCPKHMLVGAPRLTLMPKTGWQCPVCGIGVAPHMSVCPCCAPGG